MGVRVYSTLESVKALRSEWRREGMQGERARSGWAWKCTGVDKGREMR